MLHLHYCLTTLAFARRNSLQLVLPRCLPALTQVHCANMTNILTKLLIFINLLHSILCLDSDVTSSSNNKFIATVNKVSSATQVANNRVSKLRLILLSDIKQNEIVSMFSTHICCCFNGRDGDHEQVISTKLRVWN